MTVEDVILKLESLPSILEVKILYDGAARSGVDDVYHAIGGFVVIKGEDEPIYYDEDQPIVGNV